MKIVKIKAYEYAELSENAKDSFINQMYDMPFDYEMEENHKIITKYDYFGDWCYSDQLEFCQMNEFLFDKYGNIICSLIIDERSQK